MYWLFAALVACLVVAVLWSALRSGSATDEAGEGVHLDGALEALRALEFERETGKVAEDEYRRLRGRLEAEALRARDAVAASVETTAAAAPSRRPCPACGRALEGRERFCPACGRETRSRAGAPRDAADPE